AGVSGLARIAAHNEAHSRRIRGAFVAHWWRIRGAFVALPRHIPARISYRFRSRNNRPGLCTFGQAIRPSPTRLPVMATRKYSLNPQSRHQILALVRAGSFPQVAAESAGIPGPVFLQWLARGNPQGRPRGWRRHQVYTPLWHAVMQSVAIARAGA